MQHIPIKDISPKSEVRGTYLLSASSSQQAKNGPYWNVTLSDASGNISAKIWSPLSLDFAELPAGSFVEIGGRSDLYRDQLQLTIDTLRILKEHESVELDMSDYVPSSPYNIDVMWQEMQELCAKELQHKPWQNFVFSVLGNTDIRLAWMACPAAKNVHHAYRGGLLEHSLSVAKLCMSLANHYPELDRQVLLAGALFHDLGKIWEYSFGLVTDYTDAGRLLGHMQLALDYLQPILQASELEDEFVQHFKHLILSHHGSYEFGSARVPQTPEAMLLHYADNIDAKMAQCKQIFSAEEEGFVGWSPYQRTLERYMYQPQRLVSAVESEQIPVEVSTPIAEAEPDEQSKAKPKKQVQDMQCSLL